MFVKIAFVHIVLLSHDNDNDHDRIRCPAESLGLLSEINLNSLMMIILMIIIRIRCPAELLGLYLSGILSMPSPSPASSGCLS